MAHRAMDHQLWAMAQQAMDHRLKAMHGQAMDRRVQLDTEMDTLMERQHLSLKRGMDTTIMGHHQATAHRLTDHQTIETIVATILLLPHGHMIDNQDGRRLHINHILLHIKIHILLRIKIHTKVTMDKYHHHHG